MISFPNAKINLGLNIVEKRPDGYHNLETIFYPVPITDALEISRWNKEKTDKKYHFAQDGLQIAGDDENNLVVKAYKLLDNDFSLPPVSIRLLKKIPFGAGLGGGSSDAAFMIKMLNDYFELQLDNAQMETYAAKLGADCAFFIQNQPTYAEGIGNIFSPINLSLKGYKIVMVKPDIFVSTREAFSSIKPTDPSHPLKEIINLPIENWKELMKNDFEESVFPQYPAIARIKEQLYEEGAIYASMSGSGSSVYGIFAPNTPLPDTSYGIETFVFKGDLM